MKKQLMTAIIAAMTITAAAMPAMANTGITMEQAKQIALQRAGLNASDVVCTKACLDMDDGRMEYDIDFRAGSREYDCDVDAQPGLITKYDLDYADYDDMYDFDD